MYTVLHSTEYDQFVGNVIPIDEDGCISVDADLVHPVCNHYPKKYTSNIPTPEKELENAFFFHYPWAWNFQHWVFDCLPKLQHYFNIKEQYPNLPILIGDYDVFFDFQKDGLEILGLTPNLVKVTEPVLVKNLIFAPNICSNFGEIHPSVHQFFKFFVDKIPNISTPSINKIYISRNDAFTGKYRRLLNQDKILRLTKSYEFVEVEFSKLNWAQKKATLRDTKEIIGPIGAGWTNACLFAQNSNCLVIERPNIQMCDWYSNFIPKLSKCNKGIVVQSDNERKENIEWECDIEDFTTKFYDLIDQNNLNSHRNFYKKYEYKKSENYWYHSFDFPELTSQGEDPTPSRKNLIMEMLPNLKGKTVLDCGSWDGYFAFLAERLGASRVLATDYFCWHGPGHGHKDNFDYAKKTLKSNVEELEIDIPNLCVEKVGKFDVVMAFGLIYHLPSFLTSLVNLCEIAKEAIIIETQIDRFIPQDYACLRLYTHNFFYDDINRDDTTWFVPNIKCVENVLEYCGFNNVTHLNKDESCRAIIRGSRT